MNREIIFAVYNNNIKTYIGFFKQEEDAITEVKIQYELYKQNYPYAILNELNQVVYNDKKIILIHPTVLR